MTDNPSPPANHADPAAAIDAVSEAIQTLSKEVAKGNREDRPSRLPIDEIVVCPEAFDVRGEHLAEHHLTELKRALERISDLDPVLVMPCGDSFVLIDGHHRMEAYQRDKERQDIPVTYFEGSIEDAILEAARVNSKAVLPLNNQQRQNLAWRLVRSSRFSKKQLVEASAVSYGQISNMRRAMKALGEDANSYDEWWKAQNAAADQEEFNDEDYDHEAKLQEQACADADRMAKLFSTRLARNPALLALVLEHYCGRNLKSLYAELGTLLVDLDDDDDEDF